MINRIFLFFLIVISGVSAALHQEPEQNCLDPSELTCQQVVAVIDLDWPPYGVQMDNRAPRGLAVDVAEQIFKELDIPLKIISNPNDYQLYHGLLTGKIDLVLATYDYPNSEELFGCLNTRYMTDYIQVLHKKSDPHKPTRWLDLQGREGLLTRYQKLDQQFESEIGSNLYITQVPEKIDFKSWISNFAERSTAQYLIGSELQWQYLLQQPDFHFLPVLPNMTLRFKAPVYMAFSIHSKCHRYAAYLRQRLAELQADGTIDRYLSRYVEPSQVKKPSKNDELPSSEHEKLNYH